jgi:hypothetical protein
MVINTSAPQVVDSSPSSPKVTRPEKSTKGDSDSNHAPINQYLQHPKPPILKVDAKSRLVNVVASMNCLWPPIEDLLTCRIIQKKRPILQTTITFVDEHNYEQPHIDDGILDIEG